MKLTARCTKIMGYSFRVRIYGALVIIATVVFLTTNCLHLLHPISVENLEWSFEETFPRNSSSVKVLLWTNFWGSDFLKILPTETLLSETKTERIIQCPNSQVVCTFTKAHNEVGTADAVVFHARDLHWGLQKKAKDAFPKTRRQDQPWVFFHGESPANTHINLKSLPNIFNWTMTYRSDSDIPFPHKRIVRRKEKKYEQIELPLNRTNLVAWTVSHCNAPSGRDELAKQLQEHIPVDIYGKCGDHKCPPKLPYGCHGYLEKLYKFYLSFENSLCSDYVTEKFFNALNSKMIPVVYGRVDYASIAPPKSFINVQDYNSTKELAEYLLWLADNPEEYAKYFEWKKDWEVVWPALDAYCGLCDKLAEERASGWKIRKSYSDLNAWWLSEVGYKLTEKQILIWSNGILQETGNIKQSDWRPACVKPTIIKKNSH